MNTERIREKIEYILKHPPTWTDGNPKTQTERIMDVIKQREEEMVEKIGEKVESTLSSEKWINNSSEKEKQAVEELADKILSVIREG